MLVDLHSIDLQLRTFPEQVNVQSDSHQIECLCLCLFALPVLVGNNRAHIGGSDVC